VTKLNKDRFAGFSNWRLPTLKEAMSLTEPKKWNGDLYLDSKFDKTQRWIWTADTYSAGRARRGDFDYGGCDLFDVGSTLYVRAGRSGQ